MSNDKVQYNGQNGNGYQPLPCAPTPPPGPEVGAPTLADAQPGGRVRLGDQPTIEKRARELLAAELHKDFGPASAQYVLDGNDDGCTAMRAIIAALSAQPSPGGQGDALELLEAYDQAVEDLSAERSDGWNEDNRRPQLEADVAELRAELIAALAARQPVASMPEWFELVIRDVCELDQEEPDAADTVCIRLLDLRLIMERHAPPAQAVDLGPVRDALKAAEGLATICASVDGYSREEVAASGRAMRKQFADALVEVDSQAVGNG